MLLDCFPSWEAKCTSPLVLVQLKGWYSKLQRDEVVAEWRRVQGKMSLHVHCHISGGNFLHNFIANLRFYIFRKELPVVLEAFRHGDEELLKTYPGNQSVNYTLLQTIVK